MNHPPAAAPAVPPADPIAPRRRLPLAWLAWLAWLAGLAWPALALTTPAQAATDRPTLLITTERQTFAEGRGTLDTLAAELQLAAGADHWSLAPTIGRRAQGSAGTRAAGGAVRWHRDWPFGIGTTTEAFVAEAGGPFATASLAESLAVPLARGTELTGGLRWSRYQGGTQVWFASAELRRYFRGGSAAYRLTRVAAPGRPAYLTHLVALSRDDRCRAGRGCGPRGRSQLWLSIGQAALVSNHLAESFRGHDWSLEARRVQPLDRRLALTLSGGLASYDLPGRALHARSVGLGLLVSL